MKKLFLLGVAIALLHPLAAIAAPDKGDSAPRPNLLEVLNTAIPGTNWDSYQGKVILLEAWATW